MSDAGLVLEQAAMEKGDKVLYVMIQKVLYGMLVSAVLFYKKLRKDLEGIGFIINPYDTHTTT